MKTNSFAFCLTILLLLSVSVPCFSATLNVQAFVDGKSRLYIQGSNVWWYHIEAAAPGREGAPGTDYPTILNGHNWYPRWPGEPPITDQRDCGGCESIKYHNLSPALATDGAAIQVVEIDIRDKETVSIIDQPIEANGYTAIVEFNDPEGGAYWSKIEITYSGSESTTSVPTMNEWGMIFMSLLLAGTAIWVIRRRQTVK
jgi:hypothetical protein